MTRYYKLFFVFLFISLGTAHKAEAQFWKKLFGKDEPKRKPVQSKPTVKESPKPAKPAKPVFVYPETEMKSRYRIDVLVPLYLDELVVDNKPVYKGKIPEKAQYGIDFYEGLKLAADTLSKLGYNIDVYIHDITTSAEWPETLVKRNKLDASDLIIASVPAQNIPILAEFAEKQHINVVSALSPSDADVKNNPYFIMMQPSLQTHCEWIMDYISRKHGFTNTTLLYRTSTSVDKAAYQYLLPDTNSNLRRVQINSKPTKEQLAAQFSSKTTNIIILGVLEIAYAEEILYMLHDWFPEYDFIVYGMPSLKSMNSLKKPDAYPNVAVYFTAPFYFDPTTGAGHALASAYKRQYGGNRLNEMVFRGYETMYWYAYLLKKYGTIFNEKLSDNSYAPFTRYQIKKRMNADEDIQYLENTHISLYKYQSGSYMVEQ